MEFMNTSLISPLAKNVCRTCLLELDSAMLMNIQDVIENDLMKVKLIDILVFLNCLENNDEENWPQSICTMCVMTAFVAYNFKINCLKANTTLSKILTIQTSPSNVQRSDIDSIDINIVNQDHEYDVPLFTNNTALEFENNIPPNKKELTPLPPVTEITATEQPPRKQGEKIYVCTECGKSFTRIYNLRYHMTKHGNFRKYLCAKCGKSFHLSKGLRQHLLSHKEVAQFKCGFCNKTYKSRQSLKHHFQVAHSNNRKLFVCVTCGKSFTKSSTLMMHIRSHNDEKSFACPSCPKKYTRASYLRAHSLVHLGQERPRPFACKHTGCNRSFTTKHSLLVHIAHSHTTERPHKCGVCSKGFATSSGLKIHRESHNIKEESCNICGKIFTNKRVLHKHMRSHNVDPNDMIFETVVDDIFFS